jgi:competence protein ComEC
VTGVSRLDWRLVPAAIAVWLATLLGLLVHWWFTAALGVIVTVAGIVLLIYARGCVDEIVRRLWQGVAASLVICGVGIALVTTLRLRAVSDDPLRLPAAQGASGQFRVELDDRPRPVFSAGFGGRQGGIQAVAVPATVVRAVVSGKPVDTSGTVLLVAPVDGWSRLLPGQEVDLDASLAPAKSGGMTVAVLRVRGPPGAASESAAWQRWAQALRSGLHRASGVLGPESAGLLPALTVGDTDVLPRNVVEEFRAAGMAHLLAVSGANLAIICIAVLLLLRAIRIGPRGSAVGAGLTLVGFVVLAGPEPSVLRAGVMGAVGLLALAMGRERLALPALSVAVIGLVLHDPSMATSLGFAMSVLATAGLVLLAPRWSAAMALRGVPRGLAEALAVPAAAHLVTAPIVAGMAGQVSMIAVLANLLAAPVVAPATVLGVLAAVFASFAPWLAELMVRLAGPEVGWLIMVARHGSRLPGATISWPSGWWGALLLLVIIVGLLVALRHRRTRVIIGVALTMVLIVVIPVRVILPGWPPTGWAVVACDVGQADATRWHRWSAAVPTASLLAVRRGARGAAVLSCDNPGVAFPA